MKKSGVLFFILLLILLSGCCLWNPNEHHVRIEITVPDMSLEEMMIGGTSYGMVTYGTITDYKIIKRDTEYSITYGSEEIEIGTIELNGLGTHHWTLEIRGSESLIEPALVEE